MRRKYKRRGRRWPPPLTESQILAWADAFHERTGKWPKKDRGRIAGSLGEKWDPVDQCLRIGLRGLPGGSSLARLLAKERGVRNVSNLPPFSQEQILEWADVHHERRGAWPSQKSGPIAGSQGEKWVNVDDCLRNGNRDLPGGSSLARLLEKERGARNLNNLPPLSPERILAWADAFHERTGAWPKKDRGRIAGSLGDTWAAVDMCLRNGLRGLPGGSSLARLLEKERGVRNEKNLPPFSRESILAWADAFHKRTGLWPNLHSGRSAGPLEETWCAVDSSLRAGIRGLPGGSSLARLLTEERGVRNNSDLPPLSPKRILAWADAFHERIGAWPKSTSGRIAGTLGETWCAVNVALCNGCRGLPGGSSLPQLLAQKRGIRNTGDLPPLTESQILAWADAFHERTGTWPNQASGRIAGTSGEKWSNVDDSLYKGQRGLPGGSSLARLLARKRGVRNRMDLPPLRESQILAWADDFHKRMGTWPKKTSGRIEGSLGEKWDAVADSLYEGLRGLPGGSSLARLLAQKRGARNQGDLPALTEAQILAWADAFYKRTGVWPKRTSGRIEGTLEEKWSNVNQCLAKGLRGLPGGSSLARLLAKKRGVRNRKDLPPLTTAQILRWADAHQRRLGTWPTRESGPIHNAPGETWLAVDATLRQGNRGFRPGGSLARFLKKHRGV